MQQRLLDGHEPGQPGAKRAQPRFGLAEQPTLARALVEHGRRQLGVNVIVEQAGVIRAGDPVLRVG